MMHAGLVLCQDVPTIQSHNHRRGRKLLCDLYMARAASLLAAIFGRERPTLNNSRYVANLKEYGNGALGIRLLCWLTCFSVHSKLALIGV